MNKKDNLHICNDCNNFSLIYKKSVYNFDKTDLGICFFNQEIIKKVKKKPNRLEAIR